MSENDEIKAAMGFGSFGRVTRSRNYIETDKLPQLIPGTELANRLAEFPADCIKEGSHGVLSLLCRTTDFDALQTAVIYLKDHHNNTVSMDEDMLSHSKLLQELEQEKLKFDKLTSAHFLAARAVTNRFESLGKHIFLNRSAMKLATLDYIFQWTFGQSERQDDFSFADLCGGPGGFSEYLLWRMTQNGQKGHGYGITLKDAINNCDWRLPLNLCSSMTICYGEDGTGNLYSIPNIHSFRTVVRRRHPDGVDLTVADGGFLEARSQLKQVLEHNTFRLAKAMQNGLILVGCHAGKHDDSIGSGRSTCHVCRTTSWRRFYLQDIRVGDAYYG